MKRLMNRLIERTCFRGLVFNQSWEDPDLDREALRIMPDQDRVLSITSGGCNSLSLLCLRPRQLICIDANPAQSYVLELKLAGIRHLDHGDFYRLFGSPDSGAAASIYHRALRPRLSADAKQYWDRNIRLLERGLLTQGRLGLFLRLLRWYLRWQVGQQRICALFRFDSIEQQRDYYYSVIHPRLWRRSVLWILRSRPTLALAGMHPRQYELIQDHEGLEDYLRARVEHVLTSAPIRNNYFAAQALLGAYLDREEVPPYLLEQNFAVLKQMADRVTNVTGRLPDYLHSLPEGSIDKFSLSDVFDWMSPETFLATLRAVLRVGSQGGRFIYRSTIRSLPVPPELHGMAVGEEAFARQLLARDRSVTYSSFYVYRIDKEHAALNEPFVRTPG